MWMLTGSAVFPAGTNKLHNYPGSASGAARQRQCEAEHARAGCSYSLSAHHWDLEAAQGLQRPRCGQRADPPGFF